MFVRRGENQDGLCYEIVDNFSAVPAVIGRFKTLEETGAVIRYLSGQRMSDLERSKAIIAIQTFDKYQGDQLRLLQERAARKREKRKQARAKKKAAAVESVLDPANNQTELTIPDIE